MLQLAHGDVLRFLAALPQHLARREHHVLEHGQVRKGVELLEDDADLLPQLVEIGAARVHLGAVDENAAALDRLEAVHAHQQRRLARARAAEDRDDLAFRDRHRHALQHLERAEGLVDVVYLNHGHRSLLPSPRASRRGGRSDSSARSR